MSLKDGFSDDDLQLTRFMGRPGELSPKARFWMFAGWLLPSRFKYVFLYPVLTFNLTFGEYV